ncbi:MAG: hypothetical protein GX115_09735 [Ruminiclostridium sp.]|nr:hypothetical protein [Ruminiclostridium sp.]
MQFTNEIIGARLLETITAGLYDGNLNCVREYVQNSIDEGAKNVDIFLENGNTLVIHDDGPGMDESALKKALSIGISSKEGGQIGWRGLGIWSGVSASMRIVILSKMKNKPKIRMEIDNDILRNVSQSNEPITDILTKATSEIEEVALGKRESLEDDHFTTIRLETILQNQRRFFSDNEILRYLQKIVPAPFDLEKFPRLAEVNSYLTANGVTFPNVEIRFNNERIYRPPYNGNLYYEPIIPYAFTFGEKTIAVGWFITTKESKTLKWPNGGIFFKKKGMTIGDENLIKSFYIGTYNQWQYGEIHIISKNIRENAGRNGFEYNSDEFKSLIEQVEECITQLQSANRYQAEAVKFRKLNSVSSKITKGDISGAKKIVKEVKASYAKPRSFPSNPAFIAVKTVMDSHAEEIKEEFDQIANSIDCSEKDLQAELIRQRREELNRMIDTLPKAVKESIKRSKGKGLLNPVNTVADAVEELLKEKTGENATKFIDLVARAYGFGNVNPRGDGPLLRFHPKDEKNRRFGVMVYTFYDLIINSFKHEKGYETLEWLEGTTEAERLEIMKQIVAVMGLLYRLIDHSERV